MTAPQRQEPQDVETLLKEADQLAGSGKKGGAISLYTRAIEIDPFWPYLYAQRGHAWLALGEHENALSDFSHCVEAEPENPCCYMFRALAYYVSGDMHKSIQDNNRAFELRDGLGDDDEIAQVLYCRGMAYRALKQEEEAEADFRLARVYDPDGKSEPVGR